IFAYSSLPQIESRIASQLAKNPDNPQALAIRGELRLQAGNDAAAIEDLRRSLQLAPTNHASLILVDLLMKRLRERFPADHNGIGVIERFISDDHQRAECLTLRAQGFEQQGNLQAAVEQYLKLASLSRDRQPLMKPAAGLAVR